MLLEIGKTYGVPIYERVYIDVYISVKKNESQHI